MPQGRTVGSLDLTRRVPQRLAAIGVSLNFFGKLLGMSSAEVSRIFGQTKALPGDKAERIEKMVKGPERLAEMSPAPVLFKDSEQILDILQRIEDGRLVIGISRDGGPVEVHPKREWNFGEGGW